MKLKVIIYLAFLCHIVKQCQEGETFYLDDDNKPQCIKCPDNCQYCSYTIDKTLHCYFCDDNYYRDNEGNCQPCAKNCANCQGSTLDSCTRLEEGFFYSNKKKDTIACKIEGCGHCANQQLCTSCSKGYIEQKVDNNEQKQQGMNKQVTCEKCDIPHCTYCTKKDDQLKKQYLSCTLCEKGFYVQNEKCEKCPENCEHCASYNGECFDCMKGYRHNKMKNTCEQNIIEHCHEMEDNERCSSCETHFFMSEDKKSCHSCSEKIPGCLYCSNQDNQDFRCHSCKDGYYYDQETKTCQTCTENCISCTKEKCYSCKDTFTLNNDNKNCEPCQIEHCKICGDKSDGCFDCGNDRFYNKETKKCEKCDSSCIGCYQAADNCTDCPVTHYTFRQEIMVEQDAGEIQGFVGPLLQNTPNSKLQHEAFHIKHKMIKIRTKCLKKCPKKFEKHQVIQDETLKECFKVYEDAKKSQNFIKKKFEGNLHEKMQQIVEDYHKQIEEDYKNTIQGEKNDKNEDCTFHGTQKYEIRGVYDNYKFCVCDEAYVGPICEIPRVLYDQTQLNVSQLLEQCSQHLKRHDIHRVQRHLHSLKRLVKIKLSLPIIEKLINMMYLISHNDLNIRNKIVAFRIYDYLLCRLVEIKELESHKDIKEREFDSLIVREKFDWENLIKQIMLLIEHTLLENNVKESLKYVIQKEENIISQDSYNIYEYQLKNYFPEKGFGLDNPYLNDYYSKYIGSHVYFEAKNNTLQFFSSNYIVQMIYFDAQLFDSLIEDQNHVLLTNVLHMNLINPEESGEKVYPNDANIKKITIQFSLLFLPLKEDFIEDVECTAFVYDKNLHSLKGTVKNMSKVENEFKGNEEDFLICEFEAYFPLDDHYFAILLKKN